MKLPCDLVAFMRQEEGSGIPEKLKEELLSRKDAYEIDKNDDRDTGMNKILFFNAGVSSLSSFLNYLITLGLLQTEKV